MDYLERFIIVEFICEKVLYLICEEVLYFVVVVIDVI